MLIKLNVNVVSQGRIRIHLRTVHAAETENDICGISPMDVQLPNRVQKAFRHELLGLGIHLGIPQDGPVKNSVTLSTLSCSSRPAHEPHIHEHSGTPRDEVPVVFIISDDPVWKSYQGAGVPSEQLLHECADVWEGGAVRKLRESFCAHDGI